MHIAGIATMVPKMFQKVLKRTNDRVGMIIAYDAIKRPDYYVGIVIDPFY